MAKQLLWIHGWGVSSSVWDDVEDMLPEYNHHFVSFAKCITVEDLHRVIMEKLISGSGDWTLIGWSMGAMLALETVFDNDQRMRFNIEAIVLVSASLQFINRDRRQGWPLRVVQRMNTQLSIEREETLSRFKELMLSPSDKNKMYKDDLEKLKETDFSLAGLKTGLSYLMDCNLRDKWQQFVQQPDAPRWFWIHGDEDAVCPIGCLPNAQDQRIVVIEKGGHLPFWTAKTQFFEQLRSFLDAHE